MKIVNYHPRALIGDGGISNSVRYLSASLAKAGSQPVIAYDAADGPPPDDDQVEWVPVAHRGTSELRVPLDLERVLDPHGVLVLNSAWTLHNVRAGALARQAGMPYVVAPRGAYDPLIVQRRRQVKRVWWTAAERALVSGAAAVHVFFAEQSEHIRELGFRGRILVAPNGITVPDDVQWDGGSGGYLLYVGRFDPEHKGLDLLIDAVATLPDDQRPTVRLVGPDWKGGLPRVVATIAERGLEQWVTTHPAVYGADKWNVLRQAAAFAYPSRWEGFGNSLAEAAAIGLPALATPYPLARHLQARGAAVVAEPDQLAAGITEVLSRKGSPDLARTLREEFTWDSVARLWLEQAEPLPQAGA